MRSRSQVAGHPDLPDADHLLAGAWSRRISEEHRSVGLVDGDDLVILQARYRSTQPAPNPMGSTDAERVLMREADAGCL